VEPAFQKRYAWVIVCSGIASALTGGMFAYSFIRSTLELTLNVPDSYVSKIMLAFLFWFFLTQLVVILIFYLISFGISQRAAGPVYALNKFLREVLEGKAERLFQLRTNDEFKFLEPLGQDVANEISSLKSQIKKDG
jgi:signal peptidase II